MEEESGYEATLGGKIIYFGIYKFSYANGKDGEGIVVGFAPQKTKTTIYIMPGFSGYEELLKDIGKHKISKCCLYINKLEDLDEASLRQIVRHSVGMMHDRYVCRGERIQDCR